ncbi:MAG: alpha-ketoglutarate-dependent dioxygenase AlkB, partial [Flavobacteriales bacterium]|nr:alpha-ketoglutarate-dependent dioxygenase AlkB [Flavobacteriales bacterium]
YIYRVHRDCAAVKTIFFEESSKAVYIPDFCPELNIDEVISKIQWRNNSIRMFGKYHPEPRLTAWYGKAYQYANIQWEENPLPEFFKRVIDKINLIDEFNFNSALCNLYRNGNDHMGWHRDNEREMDTRLIASLSLGATRTFKIRHRETKEVSSFELEHGSLMMMYELQDNYEHCIPKRLKVDDQRLNITFRHILTPEFTSE